MSKRRRNYIIPAAIATVVLISTTADFDMSGAQNQTAEQASMEMVLPDKDTYTGDMVKNMASGSQQESSSGQDVSLPQDAMAAQEVSLPQDVMSSQDMVLTEDEAAQDSLDKVIWAGDYSLAAGSAEEEEEAELVIFEDAGLEASEKSESAQEDNTAVDSDMMVFEGDMIGSDDELYLPKDKFTHEEPAPQFYSQGVTHSSVADIQERLMDLGFMDYAEPTIYYGSITMEAVKMFQRQHGLKEDGIIGPQTKELLFSDEAKYYLAKVGMRGDDIRRIQQRLYEMGYLAKEEYVTGYFGDVTEQAVKSMQKNNGVLADGKVGHDTMELLYSEDTKPNLLSYGDKSDVILECQNRLKELGYLTTKPDGQYGNDTVAAVKLFQSRNDIVVDGYLGPATMQVLHSSAAVPNGIVIGESGDTVKRVQELLVRYGYMSSANCTGYFGEITENAVMAFQKNNGLTADGNVGMKTMNKLTGGDAVKAGATASGSTSSGSSNSSSGSNTGIGSSSGSSSQTSNTSSVSALLAVAKSKLGSKYVYGAKGPNTFDCYGYVYWCLNQVGVKQSYITSYGWRNVGKYQKITKFSDIKAGDILVVTGHVGIAAGNGMVYDASSSSGKIVYRSLGSWWKNRFICAWRIF